MYKNVKDNTVLQVWSGIYAPTRWFLKINKAKLGIPGHGVSKTTQMEEETRHGRPKKLSAAGEQNPKATSNPAKIWHSTLEMQLDFQLIHLWNLIRNGLTGRVTVKKPLLRKLNRTRNEKCQIKKSLEISGNRSYRVRNANLTFLVEVINMYRGDHMRGKTVKPCGGSALV